jgi:hypothetical protein
MSKPLSEISRISKIFIDRDQMPSRLALERRRQHAITLVCGGGVAQFRTLQLALLTAANLANRCFPGAVRIVDREGAMRAPLLVWPSLGRSLGEEIISLLGPDALKAEPQAAAGAVIIGDAIAIPGALRLTFDGWIAKVGPAGTTDRLQEREYCSLAGVLAAALAVSELFLSFADISVEASRRTVALSLWRPDADIQDAEALGIPIRFLPQTLWVLGLGHLGNAYLWAVATLPYLDAAGVDIFLNDFDKVETGNVETGVIFRPSHVGKYKTRICNDWLAERGFQTRLIERHFDSSFRRRPDEPGLALCGFDSNAARRDLATARFLRVIESGLGGSPANFDTISLHTFPNPRAATELWPDLDERERELDNIRRQHAATGNPAYQDLSGDECGRFDLAGKSIAVPFVGMVAASFVVAEATRLLHQGPSYTDIKLSLGSPDACYTRATGNYAATDFVGLTYADAAPVTE